VHREGVDVEAQAAGELERRRLLVAHTEQLLDRHEHEPYGLGLCGVGLQSLQGVEQVALTAGRGVEVRHERVDRGL